MIRSKLAVLLALVLAGQTLVGTAAAQESGSDSRYCFSAEEFCREEGFAGICITALPRSTAGTLQLGQRQLRPGDFLTAQQLDQVEFVPTASQGGADIQVSYLPILTGGVAQEAVMTFSIRGREDQAPAAEDFALETYKNLPIRASLKVTDPESQPMTYTLVRQSKRGTVAIEPDGTFTYTPKKNKVGVDSFVYTATDPAGNVSREATVTVTILKTDSSTQYTDTQGQSCRFAAEWMKNTGIFVGEQLDGNARFCPDREVTRGEFVTMMVKALELMEEETVDYTGYSDEIPQWLRPYVAAAVRSGITSGLPQQHSFGAEEPITGAEAAVMLRNALDLPAAAAGTEAGEDVPEWAAVAVCAMAENGMTLSAGEVLTRGEAAQLLYTASRMLQQAPIPVGLFR